MSCRTLLSGFVVLVGCVGYSDGSGSPPDAADPEVPEQDGSASEPAPVDGETNTPDAGEPTPDAATPIDTGVAVDADVLLGYAASFDGYLMDRTGQPLYMLADDVAGTEASACTADCAAQWPAFDLQEVVAGPGLQSNEFTRFHRQDGDWQTAFKGHPLYRKASEAGRREVTGDGVEGRWFVARDYLAFLGRTSGFAPAGAASFESLYLTNGVGRTLYICFADVEGSASVQPVSSCLGDCALRHPLWSVAEASRTSILPSVMRPGELGQFRRPDGALQLTYRGWPLYYFGGDERAGDVQGHNQEAWRALDPVNFSGQREP